MFSQASVILFTGGNCIPACTGADTPPGRHMPACTGADPPPGRHIPACTGADPPKADICQHVLGQTPPRPGRHIQPCTGPDTPEADISQHALGQTSPVQTRTVRILLECFLVIYCTSMLNLRSLSSPLLPLPPQAVLCAKAI